LKKEKKETLRRERALKRGKGNQTYGAAANPLPKEESHAQKKKKNKKRSVGAWAPRGEGETSACCNEKTLPEPAKSVGFQKKGTQL